MNAACFSSSRKKKRDGEKGVGKAGSQESRDRREEEENLAREQVGQCSCSLVSCVFVSRVDVLSCQRVHSEHVCLVCAFVSIFGYSCVCWGVCECECVSVCVSTAGPRGGSTAGRRCALQSASPPGTD